MSQILSDYLVERSLSALKWKGLLLNVGYVEREPVEH